ncbi:caspase family protein [Lacibacter sp. H407]|uniref:caspase family protein n=1 Tax=Lacibacter sp. H407 TaxID=3133423 RepID=UPI0030C0AA71
MKSILLFVLVLLLQQASAQVPEKYALIVAISNYAPSTGWNKLNSANDIPLIKESLKRQGFKEENIRIMRDKEGTKTGILTAMQQQFLGKAKPGDICVFHFSGHGQQVMDDNGDEADGYDEALVTYDSPMDYEPGVEKHLRDDAFGTELEKIRKHLGNDGNLLVIVDACHSGTSTRSGLGNYRGTTNKYAPKGYKPAANSKIINEGLFSLGESKPGLAPMSAFFASAASELNQECGDEHCGSLSLAFSKALAKADSKTSYRGLFDNIRLEMSKSVPGQTPNAEGDLDKEIFGGKALGKPNYYVIEKATDKKKVTIACGKIYSVFAGTTVSVYPSNTYNKETAKPIAKGTIITAGDYSSEVELDTELNADQLKTAWIFLEEVSFGDLVVPVTVKAKDATLFTTMKGIVANNKQAKLTDAQGDVFIEQGADGFSADSIYISTSGDYRLGVCSKSLAPDQLASFIGSKIAGYGRAAYLRNLNMKNEELNVVFEFVPIDYKPAAGNNNAMITDLPEKTIKDPSGNISFQHNDRYNLRVINNGQERLYYNILEIQPDNLVNVLFPASNQQPMDCFINPGDTVRLTRIFRIGPPDGMNVIKLVAAKAPLNLRQIFVVQGNSRGEQPKANNPFEKLMQGINRTDGIQTRGSGEETIQPDAVNIFSVPYKIVPKKQ